MVGRRIDEDRDQFVERTSDRRAKRSRGGVDILNAGQMRSINDTAPSPPATGSDFAAALISEKASLRRLIAKREPRQP
jgi:hypothetical protein